MDVHLVRRKEEGRSKKKKREGKIIDLDGFIRATRALRNILSKVKRDELLPNLSS